mmetsp:Transcript_34867/g.109051  ORF Transcript_34867/g.109051 Transcript_34867/m.109051 type:complete len:94 (+) Transcript_34867:520-801(+)
MGLLGLMLSNGKISMADAFEAGGRGLEYAGELCGSMFEGMVLLLTMWSRMLLLCRDFVALSGSLMCCLVVLRTLFALGVWRRRRKQIAAGCGA